MVLSSAPHTIIVGSYLGEKPCSAPQEPIALHPFSPTIAKFIQKTNTKCHKFINLSLLHKQQQTKPTPKKERNKTPKTPQLIIIGSVHKQPPFPLTLNYANQAPLGTTYVDIPQIASALIPHHTGSLWPNDPSLPSAWRFSTTNFHHFAGCFFNEACQGFIIFFPYI